jgi:hypothetical protein
MVLQFVVDGHTTCFGLYGHLQVCKIFSFLFSKDSRQALDPWPAFVSRQGQPLFSQLLGGTLSVLTASYLPAMYWMRGVLPPRPLFMLRYAGEKKRNVKNHLRLQKQVWKRFPNRRQAQLPYISTGWTLELNTPWKVSIQHLMASKGSLSCSQEPSAAP